MNKKKTRTSGGTGIAARYVLRQKMHDLDFNVLLFSGTARAQVVDLLPEVETDPRTSDRSPLQGLTKKAPTPISESLTFVPL